jgi:PAS fold
MLIIYFKKIWICIQNWFSLGDELDQIKKTFKSHPGLFFDYLDQMVYCFRFLKDQKRWVVQYASRACEQIYQVTPEVMYDTEKFDLADSMHPADLAKVFDLQNISVPVGYQFMLEEQIKQKDGGYLWVRSHATLAKETDDYQDWVGVKYSIANERETQSASFEELSLAKSYATGLDNIVRASFQNVFYIDENLDIFSYGWSGREKNQKSLRNAFASEEDCLKFEKTVMVPLKTYSADLPVVIHLTIDQVYQKIYAVRARFCRLGFRVLLGMNPVEDPSTKTASVSDEAKAGIIHIPIEGNLEELIGYLLVNIKQSSVADFAKFWKDKLPLEIFLKALENSLAGNCNLLNSASPLSSNPLLVIVSRVIVLIVINGNLPCSDPTYVLLTATENLLNSEKVIAPDILFKCLSVISLCAMKIKPNLSLIAVSFIFDSAMGVKKSLNNQTSLIEKAILCISRGNYSHQAGQRDSLEWYHKAEEFCMDDSSSDSMLLQIQGVALANKTVLTKNFASLRAFIRKHGEDVEFDPKVLEILTKHQHL